MMSARTMAHRWRASIRVVGLVLPALMTTAAAPSPRAQRPDAHVVTLVLDDSVATELDLYRADQAARKVPGVLETEASMEKRSLRIEYDPAASLPLKPIREAVERLRFKIREMTIECAGFYSVEGYHKVLRTEPGRHLFQIAEGKRTRELSRLALPARLWVEARVRLEPFESPFVLTVLSFTPYE